MAVHGGCLQAASARAELAAAVAAAGAAPGHGPVDTRRGGRVDGRPPGRVLTAPKAGRGWAGCQVGPWLLTGDPTHRQPVQASTLGHRFDDIRDAAGLPGVPSVAP